METAISLSVLIFVLAGVLAAMAAAVGQLRCADAAREAARLAGRGDEHGAVAAVAAIAPDGAELHLGTSGALVVATVSARPVSGALPGVTLRATAYAAREPAGHPGSREGSPDEAAAMSDPAGETGEATGEPRQSEVAPR